MTMSKFARTTLAATLATVLLSTAALASSDISDTGPGSNNTVTVDTSNQVTVTNDNNVTVNNTNTQVATSGDATVSGNTTAGDATTGDATNTNTAKTTVEIDNQSPCCGQGGGGGNGQGGGQGSGQGGGQGGSNIGAGASSSGVGASSTSVGSSTLPETGASQPIDVSALRNLLSHVSNPVASAAKPNPITSTALMVAAVVMSLIGAIGAAIYGNKRTLQV